MNSESAKRVRSERLLNWVFPEQKNPRSAPDLCESGFMRVFTVLDSWISVSDASLGQVKKKRSTHIVLRNGKEITKTDRLPEVTLTVSRYGTGG